MIPSRQDHKRHISPPPLQAQHYIRVAVSPTKSSVQAATGRAASALRWHINCTFNSGLTPRLGGPLRRPAFFFAAAFAGRPARHVNCVLSLRGQLRPQCLASHPIRSSHPPPGPPVRDTPSGPARSSRAPPIRSGHSRAPVRAAPATPASDCPARGRARPAARTDPPGTAPACRGTWRNCEKTARSRAARPSMQPITASA